MHEILLIGEGLDRYAGALASGGYEVRGFKSIPDALRKLNEAGLIVMEQGLKGPAAGLFKASKHIPKLMISDSTSSALPAAWLREPLAYQLRQPSEHELLHLSARLLEERRIMEDNRRLNRAVSLFKKEIDFYGEINRMLTTSRDFNKILVAMMKRAKEMIGVEAWSVMLVDENGDLVIEKTEGRAKKKLMKIRIRPDEGIAGWVATTGLPVVVPDVSKDSRFSRRIDRHSSFKTNSVMAAPIKNNNRIVGVLEVVNKKDGGSFTEEDFNVFMRLVDQTALVMEKITLYQRLEELVITDDLTNLFNTRYLNRSIETEVLRSNRYHTSVSVIFMDIDYFKRINDNYGHLIGSRLLVEMGQLLINQLRGLDIVARYGGDEFVMVLPQTSPDNAVRIAERIRRAVERHVFLKSDGYGLKLTASFGVASYPESAKSKEDLLRLADEAMYNVKHRTRNGVYAII